VPWAVAVDDVNVEPVDGKVPFRVGDRIIMRETIHEAGISPGRGRNR
jgi:hypothetical protein